MPILADRTLVVAHRGASGRFPENTGLAFEKARLMGADGIELDVMPDRHGVPIVAHDETLERMGHGRLRVSDLSLEELGRFEVGHWKDERFEGEKIPSLESVLERFGGSLRLFVEIKSSDTSEDRRRAFARRVAEMVAASDAKDPWILSFDPVSLAAAAQCAPSLPRAIDLYRESWPEESTWPPVDGLAVHHVEIDERLVRREHAAGRPVLAWTVNDIDAMHRLLDLEVDAILGDYPDHVRKARDERIES